MKGPIPINEHCTLEGGKYLMKSLQNTDETRIFHGLDVQLRSK